MGDLSPHFNRREFRCPGIGVKGHPAHPTVVSDHLIEHLEDLRALMRNRPLRIVTGHRCLWWERHRGRGGGSQHVFGRAADIPAGYCSVAQAEAAGFTGIGNAGAWAVHVDVRPGGPARWSY